MIADRAKRMRTAVAMSSVAAVLTSWTPLASADEIDSPQFRPGLWSFQRTVEHIRQAPHTNVVFLQEEMTRCVNPSVAMKAIFSSPHIGSCTSARPVLAGNQYVFAKRCDFMGPVRTEITVDSDDAYTEVNELTVGPFPRKDIVVARRIGECDSTAAFQLWGSSKKGFELSAASSKKYELSGSSTPVRKAR